MKISPVFSIIIPVYNTAPYLRECLDSVLNQTYSDWECICVNDGSTDGSGAILEEYAMRDGRFHVFHQKNKGASSARNAGLDNATGKWLWFVDSDDFIEKNALAEFMRIDDKADVTFFGVRVISAGGLKTEKHPNSLGVLRSDIEIDSFIKFLYAGPLDDVFGWTWDKIIARDVVEHHYIRFCEAISFYEDEVFAIRLAECANSLSAIPTVFYNYRILKSGLTAHGIPDPCVLAKAFFEAGKTFRRTSIAQLVDMRVTKLLQPIIHEQHSCPAADLLNEEKDAYASITDLSWVFYNFRGISVVIPVFGRDDAMTTVPRLLAWYGGLRIVVVDNGNTTERATRLASLAGPRVEVIRLEENRGGSGGYIVGMNHVLTTHKDSEFLWLLDDDAEPNEDTLKGLLKAYQELRKNGEHVASVGSTIQHKSKPEMIAECGAWYLTSPGGVGIRLNLHGQALAAHANEIHRVEYVAACSCLVPRAALEEVGPWEDVFIHYDDIEWGLRAEHLFGYKNFATTISTVFHPEVTLAKRGEWVQYYDMFNRLWIDKMYAPKKYAQEYRLARMYECWARLFHLDNGKYYANQLILSDFRSGHRRMRAEVGRCFAEHHVEGYLGLLLAPSWYRWLMWHLNIKVMLYRLFGKDRSKALKNFMAKLKHHLPFMRKQVKDRNSVYYCQEKQ